MIELGFVNSLDSQSSKGMTWRHKLIVCCSSTNSNCQICQISKATYTREAIGMKIECKNNSDTEKKQEEFRNPKKYRNEYRKIFWSNRSDSNKRFCVSVTQFRDFWTDCFSNTTADWGPTTEVQNSNISNVKQCFSKIVWRHSRLFRSSRCCQCHHEHRQCRTHFGSWHGLSNNSMKSWQFICKATTSNRRQFVTSDNS